MELETLPDSRPPPVWYPSTNFSLQISIFQIHQIFNISYFPQFNLSFEKKYLFPKTPKNLHKAAKSWLMK